MYTSIHFCETKWMYKDTTFGNFCDTKVTNQLI